jgi:hypothetical protein
MPKDDRGYYESDARPDTFSREESYGKDKRLEESKQLSAAQSTRSIARGHCYGKIGYDG